MEQRPWGAMRKEILPRGFLPHIKINSRAYVGSAWEFTYSCIVSLCSSLLNPRGIDAGLTRP